MNSYLIPYPKKRLVLVPFTSDLIPLACARDPLVEFMFLPHGMYLDGWGLETRLREEKDLPLCAIEAIIVVCTCPHILDAALYLHQTLPQIGVWAARDLEFEIRPLN